MDDEQRYFLEVTHDELLAIMRALQLGTAVITVDGVSIMEYAAKFRTYTMRLGDKGAGLACKLIAVHNAMHDANAEIGICARKEPDNAQR